MLLWAMACGDGPDATDRAAFVAALTSGACADVKDGTLRDDCWLGRAKASGADVCARIGDATLQGECWFMVAEHTKDATLCPRAAPFADDCALHVLSNGFAAWVEPGTRPGDREDDVAARIVAAGLAADDPRPWSAWYRWVLGGLQPLDRAACDVVADATRREACRRTGLALYQDRLNHARDTGRYPCGGGPLPDDLVTTPDPELDAARAARTDLCSR